MDGKEQIKLIYELSAISVFRNVLKTETMERFIKFLSLNRADGFFVKNSESDNGKIFDDFLKEKLNLFGEFVNSLSQYDYSFSQFLQDKIYTDENNYIVSVARRKEIPDCILENVQKELGIFSKLTKLNSEKLFSDIKFDGYIPQFENKKIDFVKTYFDRIKNIDKYGYGIFAVSKMFKIKNEKITPIKSADDISVKHFIGYEDARKQVFDNTQALCSGKPAANVLLYGDAGTGKSSTVKACVNYFYSEGIRLIELKKTELTYLPLIMDKISGNSLKFIIFIDDLSFNKNDDNFSILKAALEGSASAKAKNAVIYATSNRRHIVKESFLDRENGDDIHRNDTIQELTSLSDRFGLTVYFEKPNKLMYLEIVHGLAKRNNIELEKDIKEFDIKACAFALERGNFSPRTAEQYIRFLQSKI